MEEGRYLVVDENDPSATVYWSTRVIPPRTDETEENSHPVQVKQPRKGEAQLANTETGPTQPELVRATDLEGKPSRPVPSVRQQPYCCVKWCDSCFRS